MDVTITAERDLTPQQEREIMELQQAAFPKTESFVHQRWHNTPLSDDEPWFTIRRDGRLIAGVRLVPRRVSIGGKELDIGGIANVCSHPDVRGAGAGKAVMQAVREYLQTEDRFDFGLLFCNPEHRGFYAALGCVDIDNELAHEHPDGTPARRKPGGGAMICSGRMSLDDWPAGEVNLNGPTW